MRSLSEQRVQKILTAVGANCLSVAIFLAVVSPRAQGFEVSLVDAYPYYFWILAALATMCGISVIVLEAFAINESNRWISGLAVVAASNSLLLLLPLLHGYASYPAGDAQTHLGYMKDIVDTGYIGVSNFYPIVHLLGAEWMEVGGINSLALPVLLYTSWSVTFLFSICALSRVLAGTRKERFLIVAFASPLLFSNMQTVIHPSMLALFLIPFLLYAHQRRQRVDTGQVETTIVLLLLTFAITFTHPVTALYTILLLSSLVFSRSMAIMLRGRQRLTRHPLRTGMLSYRVPLLMSVTFFIWYLSFASITRSVAKVFEWLVSPNANSIFIQQTSLLALSGLGPSQAAVLLVFRYGGIALYLVTSLVATVWILSRRVASDGPGNSPGSSYAIAFLVGLAVSGYSLLGYTGEFDPVRVSRFFLLISPLVCGLAFACVRGNERRSERLLGGSLRRGQRELVVGLLVGATLLSVIGMYSSPLNAQGNWEVSGMEVAGSGWFFEHQQHGLLTFTTTAPGYFKRFQDLTCGVDNCPPAMQANFALTQVPSHFGYPANATITSALRSSSGYLITDQVGRINPLVIPANVRPQVHQYTSEDFLRLSADPSVSAIYSNGEFEVWILTED